MSSRTDAVPPSPDGVHSEHILRVASAPSTAAVTDSPDFQVADAPLQIQFASAKCVCYASLCSGGRRLAVRIAMENHIGAMPRTPFTASRDFPSRGNERCEEKNRGVICFMYYSSISPFGGWRHHLARWEACHLIRGSRGSPYESSSFATPAVRWGGKRKAP